MRTTFRVISALVALFMLSALLTGCAEAGSGEDNPSGTPTVTASPTAPDVTEEPDEPRITPDIPATADFGGEEISFAAWEAGGEWSTTVRLYRDLTSESLVGDMIKDEVFYRNNRISEAYGVTFSQTLFDYGDLSTKITQWFTTNDTTYDVVYPMLLSAAALVQRGVFTNLYDVEYIDLEKPWWDQSAVQMLTICDNLPLVATAINVNDKDATAAIAYNKEIARDRNMDDFYQLVRDGDWTFEVVGEYAAQAQFDSNGDEKYNEEDIWGFLGKHDVAISFIHGAGCQLVTTDDDGLYQFTFGDDDYDIEATEAVVDFMSQNWFYNHHVTGINDIEFTNLFETGHGLFFWMRMDEVTNMRSSETDFGILPTPKYDVLDDNYHSSVSRHTTGILSIPLYNVDENLSMTGLVLEALAADSYYNLQVAYIEQSLESRYARDEESGEMIGIIMQNRMFDPGVVYNMGGFADTLLYIKNNSAGISSILESQRDAIRITVDKFNDQMTK